MGNLGIHCEFPTCESVPCRNNGTCTPHSDRGFLCNCTETGMKSEVFFFFFENDRSWIFVGYEDDVCQTEINECLSNPCQNNASCIDQINGYMCACPKSFVGPQCQHKVRKPSCHSLSFSVVLFVEIPRCIRIFLSLCYMAWCSCASPTNDHFINNCYWSCS